MGPPCRSREPALRLESRTLDEIYEMVFEDYSEVERAEIQRRYGTKEAIAESPERIRRVCFDLIKHYRQAVEPNGFKAQIVATSRLAAVRYKQELDKLIKVKKADAEEEMGGIASAVVISSGPEDAEELIAHRRTDTELRKLIDEQFLKPEHPLKLLIVCDMLLTGFDAPVEQVMYLDKLRDHNLLQAIARVNRPFSGGGGEKTHGLIVDYWGVAEKLPEALAVFDEVDLVPDAVMQDKRSQLDELSRAHREAMAFFAGLNQEEVSAWVRALAPEDVRAKFDVAYRRFSRAMDFVYPDPAALTYRGDFGRLSKVRLDAKALYEADDDPLNDDEIRGKVKDLIHEYLHANIVTQLLEPISILAPDFEERLREVTGTEAERASVIEGALRKEITVRIDKDPAVYEPLSARLEQIIEDHREGRISAAEALRRLYGVRDDVRGIQDQAEARGMTKVQFAFFNRLREHVADDVAAELAPALVEDVEAHSVTDWKSKDEPQRRMRAAIKKRLGSAVPRDQRESIVYRLIDLARAHLP